MTEEIQQQEQAAAEHVAKSALPEPALDKIIQEEDIPQKLADDIMPGKYGLSVQQRIQKGKT